VLNEREAFKVGFLARCAEHGMTRSEIRQAVKTALDKLASGSGILGGLASAAGHIGSSVANIGIPLALVAPPVLGGIGGAMAANATDINDTDVKDIQDKEVLDTYRQETAKLKRQRQVRQYRKANQPRSRAYYG
jgi:hypothetical protein